MNSIFTNLAIYFTIILAFLFITFFLNRPKYSLYILILGSLTEKFYYDVSIGKFEVKFRAIDIITLVIFSIIVLRYFLKNSFNLPPTFWLFFTFYLVMPLSLFLGLSSNTRAGIVSYVHRIALLITAIVVYQLAQDLKVIKAGLKLLYYLAWIVIILTIVQIVLSVKAGQGLIRPSAFIFSEGVYLALFCLPLILLLAWHPDWESIIHPYRRLLLLIMLILILILTRCRISWFVILTCFLFQIIVCRHNLPKFVRLFLPILTISVTLFLIGITFLVESESEFLAPLKERISVVYAQGDIRWIVMRAQLAAFLDSPILGVGIGSIPRILHEAAPEWWSVDNISVGGNSIITGILVESGFLGLSIFIIIFIKLWRLINRMKAFGDYTQFLRASSFYFCTLSTVLWSLFQPPVINNAWFWLFMGLCWASILPKERCQKIHTQDFLKKTADKT